MSASVATTHLPTLYEYYTEGGIHAGLSDAQKYFTLNNKNITIYSGAFHYFRVPRAHWRDRLRKMRAAGLNTVDTSVPWNLHQQTPVNYDFGYGGTDMSDFLHLEEFLKTAKEEDLFALVRPGPFIGAEMEFGGLPSWILRQTKSVRNSKDRWYLRAVKLYFDALIPLLAALQFQIGGPIIGVQIENEYGNTGNRDLAYLEYIRDLLVEYGIKELMFTSDPPMNTDRGSIPGVLQTANYDWDPQWQLDKLNSFQHNKPTMTMEFRIGWCDHLTEIHHIRTHYVVNRTLEILLDYPSSVNMYMFVGGTNFGFWNGANLVPAGTNNSGLQPTTSSYDYDAPILEYGNYSEKYWVIKDLIKAHNKVLTKLPDLPKVKELVAYPNLKCTGQLLLSDLINQYAYKIKSEHPISFEWLPINENSGQSLGYVAYSQYNLHIPAGAILKIQGYIRDAAIVIVNGKLVSPIPKTANDIGRFGFWRLQDSTLKLTDMDLHNATLDIVVENCGRIYGRGNGDDDLSIFQQYKGLTEDVYLDGNILRNWYITPLEFTKKYNSQLTGWKPVDKSTTTPALYRFNLRINGDLDDTYIDMREWTKGITIVNNFVLSRHFFVGPQQSEYLPATLLKRGDNEIIIFEHYNAPDTLKFSKAPIFGNPEIAFRENINS